MDTKWCNRCGQNLPVEDFSPHPRYGRQSMCRPCNRAYQRDHYRRNRSDYLAKAATWEANRRWDYRARLWLYFAEHPCVDCGLIDPDALTFDHVRGEKTIEVSTLIGSASWVRVLEEVEKCDVRCMNCHKRRHAAQMGWRRLLLQELEPEPTRIEI